MGGKEEVGERGGGEGGGGGKEEVGERSGGGGVKIMREERRDVVR